MHNEFYCRIYVLETLVSEQKQGKRHYEWFPSVQLIDNLQSPGRKEMMRTLVMENVSMSMTMGQISMELSPILWNRH